MGKIEDKIEDLAGEFAKGMEHWRDEFRAGMAVFDHGIRLQGCRPLNIDRAPLLYGGPGRVVGWSLRADGGAVTVNLHDGRSNDATDAPIVATLALAAGESSNVTVPGVSITEALWMEVTGTGALVGSVYLGAVD